MIKDSGKWWGWDGMGWEVRWNVKLRRKAGRKGLRNEGMNNSTSPATL